MKRYEHKTVRLARGDVTDPLDEAMADGFQIVGTNLTPTKMIYTLQREVVVAPVGNMSPHIQLGAAMPDLTVTMKFPPEFQKAVDKVVAEMRKTLEPYTRNQIFAMCSNESVVRDEQYINDLVEEVIIAPGMAQKGSLFYSVDVEAVQKKMDDPKFVTNVNAVVAHIKACGKFFNDDHLYSLCHTVSAYRKDSDLYHLTYHVSNHPDLKNENGLVWSEEGRLKYDAPLKAVKSTVMSDAMFDSMVAECIQHFKDRSDLAVLQLRDNYIDDHLRDKYGIDDSDTLLSAYNLIVQALREYEREISPEPVKTETRATRKALRRLRTQIADDVVVRLHKSDMTTAGVREHLHKDPRVSPDEVEVIINILLEDDDVVFDGTWFSHVDNNKQKKKHPPKMAPVEPGGKPSGSKQADREVAEFKDPDEIARALYAKLKNRPYGHTTEDLEKWLRGSIYKEEHFIQAQFELSKHCGVIVHPTKNENVKFFIYVPR